MPSLIDLSGQKINYFTVIKRVNNCIQGKTQWLCLCSCGNEKVIRANDLRRNHIKSCGCLPKLNGSNAFKNGFRNHPLYRHWQSMKHRCLNPNSDHFKWYGDKGIKPCYEWIDNSKKFIDWAFENNWKKGLTLERKNPKLGYFPENCEWITRSENSKRSVEYNRRLKNVCSS